MGPIAGFAMARATTSDARAEIALLTSYLRQPGSARAFSRTVRDVIRWRGLFWGAHDSILPISQGTANATLALWISARMPASA